MIFSTPGRQLLAAAFAAFLSAATANDEAPRAGVGLRGLRRAGADRNGKFSNKDRKRKHDKSTARYDCTVQVRVQASTSSQASLREGEAFDCAMDPADVGGYAGLTRRLAVDGRQKNALRRMWREGGLVSGRSRLRLAGEGVAFDEREVRIPQGLDVEQKIEKFKGRFNRGNGNGRRNGGGDDSRDDGRANGHFDRRLTSAVGTKSVLVVKVIDSEQRARPESPAQIGDNVFGTLGDPVNLVSQLNDCSMGKLALRPGGPEDADAGLYSAPGVLEVELSIPLTVGDRHAIHNEVTARVQDRLGVALPGPYDHVMYVLEGCYDHPHGADACGWAAYAYVDSWMSVYQGKYYGDVGVQVHELGHNFGLAHSGGLDGLEVTDHTGSMGNPLYSDDAGKMCYNAAKNWQIGWYDDRKVTLEPIGADGSIAPDWSASLTMVGIVDYGNVPDLPVVLKIETGTADDYFVGFNRAAGANADSVEARDMVTVVKAGADGEAYSQSYLKGYIDAEENGEFAIENFAGTGTNVAIRLRGIDKSTSVWKADVWVGVVGAATAPRCAEKVSFTVNVTTDDYPSETHWKLTNNCLGVEEASKDLGSYVAWGALHSDTYWVCPGEYTFEIFDSYNDGICCSYGQGSYSIAYDGREVPVATGGEFGVSESTTFGNCDDGGEPATTLAPTKSPTRFPTSHPTSQPTDGPTNSPTLGPTSNPTHRQTEKPTDGPTTQPTNTPTNSPISGPVLATFDSSLQTPTCFSFGSACLSGALLDGKSNNREPNGDNTLDSCADGSDGTYHGDESIDHISVSVVGGEGGLRSGSIALIEATVWAWKDGSEDTADFYYATDAHDPSWVFIGSRQPNRGGARTLAVQYQLPAGSLQAVRVNFRWRGQQGGDSGSCSGGRYDDVDDLVFSVSASDGGAWAASPAELSLAPAAEETRSWGCQSLSKSRERCMTASSTCRWKKGRRGGCFEK